MKNFFLWILLFVFLSTYNYHNKENSEYGFFSLSEIEIKGIKNSDIEDIEKKLDKIRNKNLVFLKGKDFDDLFSNVNFINSVKIKKIYPNKIIITLIEDLPIGVYSNNAGEKYLLLENKKTLKNYKKKFKNLPQVYGDGAVEKYSNFYSSLKSTGFNLEMVKKFNYFSINRWDLLLSDGKLIKLPPENYLDSVVKFLEIYKKSSFKKFKVFDFRIKNELIVK